MVQLWVVDAPPLSVTDTSTVTCPTSVYRGVQAMLPRPPMVIRAGPETSAQLEVSLTPGSVDDPT
jgi:hypothetical protein